MRAKSLIVALFILFPACCLASEIGAPPLADHIPADALIYIGWAGSQSLPAAYGSSHLKAILDASALPELFDTIIPEIIKKIPARQRQDRELVRLGGAIGGMLWRHPSALYVGPVDWSTQPRMAVVCDAGDEGDALLKEMNQLVVLAGRNGTVLHAKKDGTLIVLTLGQWAGSDTLGSAPGDALINSANFKTALQQVQADAVMTVYVDAQAIMKTADAGVNKIGDMQAVTMWPRIRDGLGLGNFRQMVGTAGFDGQDWTHEVLVTTAETKTGLASLFDTQPLSDDLLSLVPQTANRFMAGHLDLVGAYRALHAAVGQFDPNVGQQFDQAVAVGNAMLGVDIENDLLDSFGDQWVMYTDRNTGGSGLLGLVVVNKLKNPERAEAALTSLSQRANALIAQAMGPGNNAKVEFRESKENGLNVHYFPLPLVAPGWAVRDGNLYLAFYPQVISAAADFASAKGPSILQSQNYLALQKRLGDHKASGISFMDLPQTAGEGYGDLLSISQLYLGLADMTGISTPAMVIPPLGKVLPHLSPMGAISWTDQTGWHFRSLAPFPGSGALGGTGSGMALIGPAALMTSILLPSMNRARETANRVKCASNERQIGQAMLMYANENKGKYPPDLGTLIKTEDIVPEVFICPDSNSVVPQNLPADQKADWVNVHSDYIYLGSGFGSNVQASQIMLYEKPGAHSGAGMNLLWGDGHVEWEPTAKALHDIDAQQKKLHAGEGGGL